MLYGWRAWPWFPSLRKNLKMGILQWKRILAILPSFIAIYGITYLHNAQTRGYHSLATARKAVINQPSPRRRVGPQLVTTQPRLMNISTTICAPSYARAPPW